MVVNELMSGSIALVLAYLLGSVPAAYIITRIATGKDIRKLGGGDVGARNVYNEVGWGGGIATGILDVGKGAIAVLVAHQLLGAPASYSAGASGYFVLAAGLVAVVGHIWPVYLKFSGGNAVLTALGVLSVLMTRELPLAGALAVVLVFITRNPVLSVNISLILVPVTGWYMERSWLLVAFSLILLLTLVVYFLPTARAALAEAGSWDNLVDQLLRREKPKRVKQKVVK